MKRAWRIVGRVFAAVAMLVLLATFYVQGQERAMRSEPLVEALETLAMPAGLVLVDEWARDGDWLLKPRPPEAVRVYAAADDTGSVCARIAEHYRASVSWYDGADGPWCGLRLRLGDIGVEIRVDPALYPWERPPDSPEGPMVRATYVATR